jgi:hypothetical protein
MICNINYYDPTNDQFLLKNVALATQAPVKIYNDKNIVRSMLNNLNNNIEAFSTIPKLNNNIIILLIILLLIIIKYYVI